MADGWTPAPAPSFAPAQPSGLLKAGTILLLVGAILSAVGALFLVLGGVLLLAIGTTILGDGGEAFPAAAIGGFYLLFGLLLAAGAILGFNAWQRARSGNPSSAFVRGLVSSLLPPLQVVTLIGAILVKVSPEAEAQARGAPPAAR